MNTSPLLRWVDVAFRYPGSDDMALRPTSIELDRGESVAIVGRSGSEKSTMLSLLGLLERPTLGSYELDGIAVQHVADRELAGIRASSGGFVFQAFHLLDHLTIEQNVALGLRYQPTGGSDTSVVCDLLTRVGLGDRGWDRPVRLSGGERQRVAIARAIVAKPALLLASQPEIWIRELRT